MASKKIASILIASTLLASAAVVSAPAMARDHGGGGNGLAIAAGIIGAVAVGSMIANANSAPAPQAYYQAPAQQVYYQAPQPVYYEQPRYYAPPPRPVQYVERTEVRTYRYEDRPYYYGR